MDLHCKRQRNDSRIGQQALPLGRNRKEFLEAFRPLTPTLTPGVLSKRRLEIRDRPRCPHPSTLVRP
ncbi:unnamed protein product [Blumeria hordei]|uniref:Uncharacterized protein n=1 Tax=Blumeria hordei TaxID=2867405 RepID=A0A383UZF5_BLUHO|nr:unnamed protein product [Blumeria hordei]